MSESNIQNCLRVGFNENCSGVSSTCRLLSGLSQPWKGLIGAAVLTSGMVMILPGKAAAQNVDLTFPVSAASGYDQQLGVTVQTRPRPLYDTPGVQLGAFEVRPQLDQTFAYDSNPTGASTDVKGSFLSHTAVNVTAASLWSRNSLATTVGADHYDYISIPGGDYTDWNVGLQGGYSIADSQLTAAYSHSDYHQLGSTIGTVRSDQPVTNSTDTTRLYYTFKFYRLEITPEFSFGAYRYGSAVIGQLRFDQQYLDRNDFAGSVTTRYALNDVGGIVIVARVVDAEFLHNSVGTPANDSRQYQLLTGLDYQSEGLWRYQFLAGGEVNTFKATQYSTRVEPVLQATVTWTPTGLVSAFGSVSRSFAEPLAQGNNGYFLNQSSLRVDYELMRNVILQGRGGVQYAEYLGGGSQLSYNFGVGANWLLNRNMRLSLDYKYYHQAAASNLSVTNGAGGINASALSQSVAGLTLHLAL
jgi:hypothetical protein